MEKITMHEIAAQLAEQGFMSAKEADLFVTELFEVVQMGLERDGQVKVKGLGTFRIIDVEARESIDVNTGERIVIEGRGKITFTPDAAMKEMVNKPFSLFETVVLNEGVTFDNLPTDDLTIAPSEEEGELADDENLPEEQEFTDVENLTDEASTEGEYSAEDEPSETVSTLLSEELEETEPVETTPTEDVPVEEAPVDVEVAEESTEENVVAEDEPEDESVDELEDEGNSRKWLWISALAVVLATVAGYLFFELRSGNSEEPAEAAQPQVVSVDSLATAPADSLAEVADSIQIVTDEAKPATVDSLNYERMDARVRTGAYRIVGLERTVKAREGQLLKTLAERQLGPDMSCYVEVFNGLKGSTVLKAGQEIKIPRLELKKRKRPTAQPAVSEEADAPAAPETAPATEGAGQTE